VAAWGEVKDTSPPNSLRRGLKRKEKSLQEINPGDFWQWAYSDFLSNALRGVLAEYIVAQAVGCTHRPRTEWDAYDLKTDSGLKIEVKSAAYLQSWQQKRLSPIRFDIGRKKGWDAETNINALEAAESAVQRSEICGPVLAGGAWAGAGGVRRTGRSD
jgi:hypothetical protein